MGRPKLDLELTPDSRLGSFAPADAYAADPTLDFAACRHEEIAHPPAVLGPTMFAAAAALEGDAGARRMLADPARRGALVDAGDAAAFADIDTENDWRAAIRIARGLHRG